MLPVNSRIESLSDNGDGFELRALATVDDRGNVVIVHDEYQYFPGFKGEASAIDFAKYLFEREATSSRVAVRVTDPSGANISVKDYGG